MTTFMRFRPLYLTLVCALILAGMLAFRHAYERWSLQKKLAHRTVATSFESSSGAPLLLPVTSTNLAHGGSIKTNPFAYRLSNTRKSMVQLTRDPHAILLENALIDTASAASLSIPKHLRSQDDPGAYIVQANG